MKSIQKYLQEVTYWQKGEGSRFGGSGKKNAPTFAWETVHGKEYPGGTKSGRSGDKQRIWNGLGVDYDLKDKWLDDLSNIKNVQIRASCQGHPPRGENPAFIIFRPKNESKSNIIVKKLHDGRLTFCKADTGNMGFTRICIATPLFAHGPKHKLWEKWWDTLAIRIQRATK